MVRRQLALLGVAASALTLGLAPPAVAADTPPTGAEVVAADGADFVTVPRTDPLATYSVPGVFTPAHANLISNGRRDESGVPGGEYWTTTFYTVLATGELQRVTTNRDGVGASSTTSSTRTTVGRGWGSIRRLVWADQPSTPRQGSLLFGLGDFGLYRYTVDAAGTVRSAGLVRGFDAAKGLTLLTATDQQTVLLVNLSGGSLYSVTVPAGGTFRATTTRVRASTWQGFEHLVSSSTGAGDPVLVTGVDTDTQRAFSYRFGAARGTATAITSLGQRTGTYPVSLRYGALSWDFSDFSPR